VLWVSGAPLDGELALGSHLAVFLKPCRECNKEVAEFAAVCLHCGAKWPGESEEPTKPKSSRSIWIILPIASCCAGFVLGAVLWIMSGRVLVSRYQDWGDFFLWSGISAVVGFFIGCLISYLLSRPDNDTY
jgi:hypothetical protein